MNSSKKDDCRTCLKVADSKMQLLNAKPKMLKVDKTYRELIEHITQIKFDTEREFKMPQGICCRCSKRVRESYTFIKQVRKCNKILMKDTNSSLEGHSEVTDDMGVIESEKSIIKKEEDSFLGDNALENADNCSSRSYMSDDYPLHLDEKVPTSSPGNGSSAFLIKVESEQNDIFPECIINENILSDGKEPMIHNNDSYDPLKEESSNVSIKEKIPPIRCEDCDIVFKKSILLNRHRRDCHGPAGIKLKCPQCPAEFNRRHNMHVHIKKFHESAESETKSLEEPTNVKETFACEYCERSYRSKYKLVAHVKSKHEPESNGKKDKKPEKRFLCTLCGLAFNSETNLDIHYRRHTGEKPFKCDFCESAFPRLYEMQIHRRSHTGEKPYKCSFCEKAFITNHKLKVHVRTHTNERPYKCTQCDKAFKQSKDLNIHKRAHTGEKPYKCGVCNSTFTQRNSLKMHQTKTKHIENDNADLHMVDFLANTQR